jgi:hypothetical protein
MIGRTIVHVPAVGYVPEMNAPSLRGTIASTAYTIISEQDGSARQGQQPIETENTE